MWESMNQQNSEYGYFSPSDEERGSVEQKKTTHIQHERHWKSVAIFFFSKVALKIVDILKVVLVHLL